MKCGTFDLKIHELRLVAGLPPDPLRELTALPIPLAELGEKHEGKVGWERKVWKRREKGAEGERMEVCEILRPLKFFFIVRQYCSTPTLFSGRLWSANPSIACPSSTVALSTPHLLSSIHSSTRLSPVYRQCRRRRRVGRLFVEWRWNDD